MPYTVLFSKKAVVTGRYILTGRSHYSGLPSTLPQPHFLSEVNFWFDRCSAGSGFWISLEKLNQISDHTYSIKHIHTCTCMPPHASVCILHMHHSKCLHVHVHVLLLGNWSAKNPSACLTDKPKTRNFVFYEKNAIKSRYAVQESMPNIRFLIIYILPKYHFAKYFHNQI